MPQENTTAPSPVGGSREANLSRADRALRFEVPWTPATPRNHDAHKEALKALLCAVDNTLSSSTEFPSDGGM
jgi:hypothetical protein